MSKSVRTCYISSKDRLLISKLSDGNFSNGISVCARNFAPFAKGSDHYKKSISRLLRMFSLNEKLSLQKILSEAVLDAHHLPGMLICIAGLVSDGEILVDANLNIMKGPNWID